MLKDEKPLSPPPVNVTQVTRESERMAEQMKRMINTLTKVLTMQEAMNLKKRK